MAEHIGVINKVDYNQTENKSILHLEGTEKKVEAPGNLKRYQGYELQRKEDGQPKIGKKVKGKTEKQKERDIHEVSGKPIGYIKGETDTKSIEAKIKSTRETDINELDVVKVKYQGNKIALGQVTKYRRNKQQDAIAEITIIGIPQQGKIREVKVPFKQENPIYRARFQELKEAMDLHPNGLYIGNMHNTNIPVRVDLERFMESHTAVFSKNRYGKSYTLRVLTEELINHGKPVLIYDSRDEYIFSEENDVEEEINKMSRFEGIEPTSYKNNYVRFTFREPETPRDVQIRLDQLQNRDLYKNHLIKPGQVSTFNMPSADGLDEEKRIIADSLEKIMELGKERKIPPCFIIIEEGESYCPQTSGSSRHLEAIQDIAHQGAQRGINLGIVGHRMAEVDKGVLSECHNYIIMQTTMDNDVRKIKKSVEGASQYEDTIKSLPNGTAYITDMVERPLLVDVRPAKTKHYGKQVDTSEIHESQASKDIEKLREEVGKLGAY